MEPKSRPVITPPGKKALELPDIIPDREMPTKLVTHVTLECDGGVFTLQLADLRPVKQFYDNRVTGESNRFEGNSAFVVEGRFAMSPICFLHLKAAMAQAEAYFMKHHGSLPDLQEYQKQLISELPAAPPSPQAPAAEQRQMGFRAKRDTQ